MAALKFNLIVLILLSSCAVTQKPLATQIFNKADGCFILTETGATLSDPVLLDISVKEQTSTECPCKSTLLNYSVFQKMDGYENHLISGSFSPLNVVKLQLPLAVQSRLIVKNKPLVVNITCATN